MITRLDREVGRVLSLVKELGLDGPARLTEISMEKRTMSLKNLAVRFVRDEQGQDCV